MKIRTKKNKVFDIQTWGEKGRWEKEESRMEGEKAGRVRGSLVLFFSLVLDGLEQYNIVLWGR